MPWLAEVVASLRDVVAWLEDIDPRRPRRTARAVADLTATGLTPTDLTPGEQQAVRDALARADGEDVRRWVRAGVDAGLAGPALARYLARLRTLGPDGLGVLVPPTDGSFSQPDQTTCGSSSLVMARMRNEPAFALWVQTGYDVDTGATDRRTPARRFRDESLAMHVRTNRMTDRAGGLQVPWPRALGTAPWAVAAEMSSPGGSGVPGATYEVRTVAASDRGATFDRVAAAVEAGHSVPLFVGSPTRPGHVVLVTGGDAAAGTLRLYDPATGRQRRVDRDAFASGRLAISGWDEPWFAVTPAR